MISTFIDECSPLASIEGMAMDSPLIVTDLGGMVEYVDNEWAKIVKRDKVLVSNLTNEIKCFAFDKEKRSAMFIHGLERAQLFSKERATIIL